MPQFKQVTIIGLGLIGGSLGMALRRRRLARRVVGVSRRSATLREAKRRGAIDAGTLDLGRGVRSADLIILATPVGNIPQLAPAIRQHAPSRAILADVGSVKGHVIHALEAMQPPLRVVGCHPLAGSERQGIRAADPHLFDGALCVVTPTRRTDRQALATVRRVWQRIGCRVIICSPARHDRLIAEVSHLPHLVASTLIETSSPAARAMAPRSFREMTLIAASDPGLWTEILVMNRQEVQRSLRQLERFLRQWQRALRGNRSAVIRRRLRRTQQLRRRLS